eukprot:6177357-Pleurochrysis_carterae.AAC.3
MEHRAKIRHEGSAAHQRQQTDRAKGSDRREGKGSDSRGWDVEAACFLLRRSWREALMQVGRHDRAIVLANSTVRCIAVSAHAGTHLRACVAHTLHLRIAVASTGEIESLSCECLTSPVVLGEKVELEVRAASRADNTFFMCITYILYLLVLPYCFCCAFFVLHVFFSWPPFLPSSFCPGQNDGSSSAFFNLFAILSIPSLFPFIRWLRCYAIPISLDILPPRAFCFSLFFLSSSSTSLHHVMAIAVSTLRFSLLLVLASCELSRPVSSLSHVKVVSFAL